MAKYNVVYCGLCGHPYYVWNKKDTECPFCEETRYKESHPKAYMEWEAAKRKNDDMRRKICDCNNLVDSIKFSLFISLPILIFLCVGIVGAHMDGSFKGDLGSISMALIIGVMLIWAIKIGLIIYSHDDTIWEVRTKSGIFLREERGDSGIVITLIIVGFILIYFVDKYFIKSGTTGHISRQCVVGFIMFGIELLMTGITLFIAIRAKVNVFRCRRQIISFEKFKKRYK